MPILFLHSRVSDQCSFCAESIRVGKQRKSENILSIRLDVSALLLGDLAVVALAASSRAVCYVPAREFVLGGLVDAGFAGCDGFEVSKPCSNFYVEMRGQVNVFETCA